MQPWIQNYNPTGSVALSTLLAALPTLLLLGLLAFAGWSAARAAAAGLVAALAVAIFAYGMPSDAAFAAAGMGAAFGLFPIGWIVFNAMFLYSLTVEAGQFEIVKASVVSLSSDRRIQALLIAFSFGAFIEGAAGFGTPVAISAALMICAGFPPLYAAGLALIANTAPVAFGALGTPIITLHKVTGLPLDKLSAMAGRQLPLFSLTVPAWMVVTMSGWRGLRGVWPAVLVSGGSFAVVQFATANFLGPELVDVAGGVISLVTLTLFLKVWQPKDPWQFAPEAQTAAQEIGTHVAAAHVPSTLIEAPRQRSSNVSKRKIALAWMPWVLLSVCVGVWGIGSFKKLLPMNEYQFSVAMLKDRIYRDVSQVGGERKPEDHTYKAPLFSSAGTSIFVTAVFTALLLRISPRRFLRTFFATLYAVRWPLATIAMMLAIAYITRYSGTDVTLGLAFTRTGWLYPLFAAMLGWLGVALTGSDTSSNALFGSLQQVTAERLGLNPILICTANSTGGVMGKMIDAQSIVVAAVATGQHKQEGTILRFVFWHSVALALLLGLLTMAQAHWLSWMVPPMP